MRSMWAASKRNRPWELCRRSLGDRSENREALVPTRSPGLERNGTQVASLGKRDRNAASAFGVEPRGLEPAATESAGPVSLRMRVGLASRNVCRGKTLPKGHLHPLRDYS